ncbi:hypothetical protein MBLNU459_g8296t1 [Dothideomycetes sp. NU459]
MKGSTWVMVRPRPIQGGASLNSRIDQTFLGRSLNTIELRCHLRSYSDSPSSLSFPSFSSSPTIATAPSLEFDHVFDRHYSNQDVFCEIRPVIESVFEGLNVCIIADGQSRSGKTYTMLRGGQGAVIPAATELAFSRLTATEVRKERRLARCEIAEIHCEEIKDLLLDLDMTPEDQPGPVRSPNGRDADSDSTLGKWLLTTPTDLFVMLRRAEDVADTAIAPGVQDRLRPHDSSVAIPRIGSLYFVDLAGSELVPRRTTPTHSTP